MDAQNQYFGPSLQTIKDADPVGLDSVFYSLNKQMPFDRYFILQCKLPGNVVINGFYITPLGKYGKRKVKRRDYRLLILEKHLRGDGLRKHLKSQYTFKKFKANPHPEIDNHFNFRKNGAATDLFLKIPPLDPNRDYAINIIVEDPPKVEKHNQLVNALFDLQTDSTSIIKTQYRKLMSDYIGLTKSGNTSADSVSFIQYLSNESNSNLFALTAVKNQKRYNSDRYERSVEYRFLVTPAGAPAPPYSAFLTSPLLIKKETPFTQFYLPAILMLAHDLGIKDTNGNAVNFDGGNNYRIYYIINDIYSGKKSDTVKYSAALLNDILFVHVDTTSINWQAITPSPLSGSSILKVVKAARDSATKVINNVSLTGYLNDHPLQLLINTLMACPCEKAGIKNIAEKDDLISVTALLFEHDSLTLAAVQAGRTTFNNNTLADIKELSKRINNLDSSRSKLVWLRDVTRRLIALDPDVQHKKLLTQLHSCIASFEQTLSDNKKTLTGQLAATELITRHSADKFTAWSTRTLSQGSTDVLEFKTAHQFKITPDFGLVAIFNAPGKGNIQTISPYLGFNINFRSIDKNIPMRHVPLKPWRYYFSVVGGITLTSVKIEGKREDLFNNNSLLGGIGFRINNYLKVTAGGVFFKKISTNPLSDEKTIATSPFVGLSVDYDLRDIFGGFINLFK